MSSLKAAVESIHALSESDIRQMFALMHTAYQGVRWDVFYRDLMQKTQAVVGRNEAGVIQGFSTLALSSFEVSGRPITGIFSGDTILAKEHWSSFAFATTFFSNFYQLKLRNPDRELYWFLISKGPKTYTVMANNFPEHYPRFDAATPLAFQAAMDTFYGAKYGPQYDALRGIVCPDPEQNYALSPDLGAQTAEPTFNPRVAYFLKSNPGWLAGEELACIARVDLDLPAFRLVRRRLNRTRAEGASPSP